MTNNSSKITLGTVQLGLDYGIANKEGKPSTEKAYQILDTAIEGGVNSFDTASGYGDSETVLGQYFKRQSTLLKSPEIITKLSISGDNLILSTSKLIKTVVDLIENSLIRLRADSVYGVMLHNAGNLHKYKGAIVEALCTAKEQGLAKNIGVSVYTQNDIDEFLKHGLLDIIQIPINVMDMRLIDSGALEALKENHTYIYARSVFLQGLFFMDPTSLPEKLAATKPFLDKLHEISQESNLTIAEIAFGFVRDIVQIDKIVIGADNPLQVEENLKLMNSKGLTKSSIDELRSLAALIPEHILNPGNWR